MSGWKGGCSTSAALTSGWPCSPTTRSTGCRPLAASRAHLITYPLFYDDKEALRTRVTRLAHPAIHHQTPASRTSHQLSGTTVEWENGAQYGLRSNLAVYEYRPGDEQRIYAGQCYHTLIRVDGKLMIGLKRVDLINCDAPLPALAVPF